MFLSGDFSEGKSDEEKLHLASSSSSFLSYAVVVGIDFKMLRAFSESYSSLTLLYAVYAISGAIIVIS